MLPQPFNKMKDKELVTLGVLLLAIVMSDRLRPLVNNMGGRLVLLLAICYLTSVNVVLGVAGAILYLSFNNGLMEGMDHEGEKEEEPAEPTEVDAPAEAFKVREGNDIDCSATPDHEDCTA